MAKELHAVGASSNGLEVMTFPKDRAYQRQWARMLLLKDDDGNQLAFFDEMDGVLYKDAKQKLRFAHFQGRLTWPNPDIAVITGEQLP